MSPKFTPTDTLPHGTSALAGAIGRIAHSEGDYTSSVPGLTFHRRNRPTEPLHCIFGLGLGVVVQGKKQALLGDELVTYGPGQSMLTTIDLPVVSQVTLASTHEPLLGLMLLLDPKEIISAAAEMHLPPLRREGPCRPLTVELLDAEVIEALTRLIRVLDEPQLAPVLAPMIRQEITVRLLAGPHGPQLQHLAVNGSPSQQIAKAVAWLKQNFTAPLDVDTLASRSHMSPSTFRQHFRSITGTSPLQYQKQLRLQEARQLMLGRNLDANSASGLVGYESASQFSREYSRLFGSPPQQDVKRLRQKGLN